MSFATVCRAGRRLALGLAALFFVPTASAQVQGISYTLSPLVERVLFDENAGLANGFLYGGELGFGFGRHVELQALYFFNPELETDYGRLTGLDDETQLRLEGLAPLRVGVHRYGGKLKLNLLRGTTVPYLTLGAGLVGFEPEHLNPSRTIFLSGGGGVQFTFGDRYAFLLGVENVTYRYNLGSAFFDEEHLAAAGLFAENFNQTQVNNWTVRTGVQIYLGGRARHQETALDAAFRRQFSGGLRGLSLRLEPFAGSISFNDALLFRARQRMTGFFAGLNFGPLVGLRGFYWRGAEDDAFLLDFDRIQAYGGEMRFHFSETPSLTPYLSFGGGYLDVLSDYVGRDGETPESEPFLFGGIGATLPLGESVALTGGVRTLLVSSEGLDNVTEPGDVYGNWMYTIGLRAAIGGGDDTFDGAVGSRLAEAREAATLQEDRLRAALAGSDARLDSLARIIALLQRGDTTALARLNRTFEAAPAPAAPRDTDRTITLPVPQEGEIYIRFGQPGGVSIESVTGGTVGADTSVFRSQAAPGPAPALSADQIQRIVRETLREQLADFQPAPPQQDDRLEAIVQARLDALEARMQAQIDRALRALPSTAPAPTTVIVREEGRRDRAAPAAPPADAPLGAVEPRRVMPFVAFMYGEPILYTLGIRTDLIRFFGPLRIHPEFVVGLGSDTYAYHGNLDGVYEAPAIAGVRPFMGLGSGILGFSAPPPGQPGIELTLNVRLGAAFDFRGGHFFAEFATFDFFDFNRYALGYRVGL